MKYKFEIEGNKVTAYCYYAGKLIQASATCHADDRFDANIGMKIAAKRLDLKIWNKRYKRASKRLEEAQIHAMIASAEVKDKIDYFHKIDTQLMNIEYEYDEMMSKFS